MSGVSDSFARPINYLRISITDRCNLRCVYCMPAEGVRLLPKKEMLSFEEIVTVVRAAADLGISKVRITGGEPLVRAGVVSFIGLLSRIGGIDDLSLTTNGLLLGRQAQSLREAGLNRVNVSLDTLRPERFRAITRGGNLVEVLRGIEQAQQVGLSPVKLNMVVMRGVNDDEVLDFARLTVERDWHVRFIEMMPVGQRGYQADYVSSTEVKERLTALGELVAQGVRIGNGPARYYRLPDALGTIGFITPISECFCAECNRLRLTAEGGLRPCLLASNEVDLRTPLRKGASLDELRSIIRQAIFAKPEQHHLAENLSPQDKRMSQIGG
ncbi:MAG: GTP 3',8-cyclase MoaA [Chloroflexota bacterium]|nr:MAG: GTP 3',8-cyclase MoaA [Chloroflexota bacterium]